MAEEASLRRSGVLWLIVALLAGVFMLDLHTPAGYSKSVLYLVVLTLAIWLPQRWGLAAVTVLAGVVAVAGEMLSPASGAPLGISAAICHRALFLVALAAVAAIAHRARQTTRQLGDAVVARTAELTQAKTQLEGELAERKRSGDALREVHERAAWLARFPDENPSPVLRVSSDGVVLYSNAGAARTPGWECRVGQPIPGALAPLVSRAMAQRQALEEDVDMGERTCSAAVAPFPAEGYANVYGRDITARKRAENVLQARLRMVAATSAGAVSVEDTLRMALDEIESQTGSKVGFYHFVEADQETVLLQYWSTNTLRNMCTAEGAGNHYPISQAGVWVDCVRERRPVIHNDYASLPHRKGLPAGHAPLTRELVVPILRGDRIVAVIGVGNKPTAYDAMDVEIVSLLGEFSWEVTERKRAEAARQRLEEALLEANANLERQVRERTRELQTANAQLTEEIQERKRAEAERLRVESIAHGRERLAMLGELAAGVAHELRNPLQGIMSYMELVKLKASGEQALTPLLSHMEEGLQEMDRVAAQLLDLSRQDQDPTIATPLGPIIERAWGFLQVRATKQGIALSQAIEPDLPLVKGNPARLTEAFLNLLKNSLDALGEPEAGAPGTIRVAAHVHPRTPGMVEVLVVDNGPGIPAEIRDKVFEPFFTTKPSGKGTGLGLAMVRKMAESCGGYVEVAASPLPGTTISLGLPVAEHEEAKISHNGFVIA